MADRYSALPKALIVALATSAILIFNGWFIDSINIKDGTIVGKILFLLFGILFGLLLTGFLKKQGLKPLPLGYFALGILAGSCGLLPYPEQSVLTTGMPNWDLFVYGRAGHRNMLFHSALIPTILLLLCWPRRGPRTVAIGLLVGFSSHLVADLFQVAPGNRIVRDLYRPVAIAWMLGNSVLAFVFAYIGSARLPES